MFQFLSNIFSKKSTFTVVEKDIEPVTQSALNVLQLVALIKPEHSEALSSLADQIKKDSSAAQSLVSFANDHIDQLDNKSIVGLGVDIIAATQPQYAPFLNLAKPLILETSNLLSDAAAQILPVIKNNITPLLPQPATNTVEEAATLIKEVTGQATQVMSNTPKVQPVNVTVTPDGGGN